MDIKQIRINNLRVAIDEVGSAAELARLTGRSSCYLSQILTGQRNGSGAIRSIGHKLARSIEIALKEPHGWMDVIHSEDEPSTTNEIIAGINAMKNIMNTLETLNKDERENIVRLVIRIYKIDI